MFKIKRTVLPVLVLAFFIPSFVFADVVTVIPSDNPSNLCTPESSANLFMFSGFSPQPTDIMVMVQGCGETTITWKNQVTYWGFSFGNYTVLESDFVDNLETATYQEVIDYGIYGEQTISFSETVGFTVGTVSSIFNGLLASLSGTLFEVLSAVFVVLAGLIGIGIAVHYIKKYLAKGAMKEMGIGSSWTYNSKAMDEAYGDFSKRSQEYYDMLDSRHEAGRYDNADILALQKQNSDDFSDRLAELLPSKK